LPAANKALHVPRAISGCQMLLTLLIRTKTLAVGWHAHRLGVGMSCGSSHAHAKAVEHGTRRAVSRHAGHRARAATQKVAGPATLLIDRPTPEDSQAQPPAKAGFVRLGRTGTPASSKNGGTAPAPPACPTLRGLGQKISEVVSTRMETRGSRISVLPVGWR